jgi:epoxyqueuosine reductase QueG
MHVQIGIRLFFPQRKLQDACEIKLSARRFIFFSRANSPHKKNRCRRQSQRRPTSHAHYTAPYERKKTRSQEYTSYGFLTQERLFSLDKTGEKEYSTKYAGNIDKGVAMEMTLDGITRMSAEYADSSSMNYVASEAAIRPDLIGFRMFDSPIFAFGDAHDPLFSDFKKPEIIGPEFQLPSEWLPSAAYVVSFFFPITERARKANAEAKDHPADEWLHARIEGQMFINAFSLWLEKEFTDVGYEAVAPSQNKRFSSSLAGNSKISSGESEFPARYASNWSERHAAYVCGLGTFGLSKGLISAKGIAGRYGSVIVSAPLTVTPRPYTGVYEYCIQCGVCAKRCPAEAIDLARGMHNGKSHSACAAFLKRTLDTYKPRYGCGQCQVAVPCEVRIPKRKE